MKYLTDQEEAEILQQAKAIVRVESDEDGCKRFFEVKRLPDNEGEIVKTHNGVWVGYIVTNFSTLVKGGVINIRSKTTNHTETFKNITAIQYL